MNVEDGLNKQETDQVLESLSGQVFGMLYDYIYANDGFRAIEPLYECDKAKPTTDDILYANQHFDKIASFFDNQEGHIEWSIPNFTEIFDSIFLPRELSMVPILNYLISQDKVMYANEKIRLLEFERS